MGQHDHGSRPVAGSPVWADPLYSTTRIGKNMPAS